MPWDPEVYSEFKDDRSRPFYDLIAHINASPHMKIIDLGCGTGELTKVLAEAFPGSNVLGIDNSAEMLENVSGQKNISFANRSIEGQLEMDEQWDVILANASLQWIGNHEKLFGKIISTLCGGGQLAVQMPSQQENILNQLLYKLVHEDPFHDVLKDAIRASPVLSLDQYTQLYYSNGAREVVIYQKVYPIIAQSADTLYHFISGSALVPYMEKLREPIRSAFIKTFRQRISDAFPVSPMVYPFKRMILVGRF